MYLYCSNNPANKHDPSGYEEEDWLPDGSDSVGSANGFSGGGTGGGSSGTSSVKISNIPNPGGRGGSTAHRNVIDSIKPTTKNATMTKEYRFKTPGDVKNSRYADKVEVVNGKVTKIYQVGRISPSTGMPVSRESKAIASIMQSPDYEGQPIYFYPYNINSQPIIYYPH